VCILSPEAQPCFTVLEDNILLQDGVSPVATEGRLGESHKPAAGRPVEFCVLLQGEAYFCPARAGFDFASIMHTEMLEFKTLPALVKLLFCPLLMLHLS
jgi:hypothetical protein